MHRLFTDCLQKVTMKLVNVTCTVSARACIYMLVRHLSVTCQWASRWGHCATSSATEEPLYCLSNFFPASEYTPGRSCNSGGAADEAVCRTATAWCVLRSREEVAQTVQGFPSCSLQRVCALQIGAPVLMLDYSFQCIKIYSPSQGYYCACNFDELPLSATDKKHASERRKVSFLGLLAAAIQEYDPAHQHHC